MAEEARPAEQVPAPTPSGGNWLGDFLAFKVMIALLFIKVIYVLGAIFVTIFGIVLMVKGAAADFGGGKDVLGGLLLLVFGNIGWRIMCECWIIFFRMHDTLKSIDEHIKHK
jgi:hypothetical protein